MTQPAVVAAAPPAVDYTFENLPLPEVDMDLWLVPEDWEENREWPPNRARHRYDRLAMFARLLEGNLSDFAADPSTVVIVSNAFQRLTRIVANLLATTLPEGVVSSPMVDSAYSLLSTGRCYAYSIGTEYFTPRPMWAWETKDDEEDEEVGLLIAEPWISTGRPEDNEDNEGDNDGQADTIEFTHIIRNQATRWTVRLSSGRGGQIGTSGSIGETITDIEDLGTARWARADNSPNYGRWGRSALVDLIPLVVAQARRLTGANHVLDKNENPTKYFPMSEADMVDAVPATDYQFPDQEPDQWGRRNIQDKIQAITDADAAATPNYIGRPGVLEYSGNLGASLQYIDMLRAEIRMVFGLPAALEEEGLQAPSGVALDKLLFILATIMREAQLGLATMWGELIPGLVWPNVFTEMREAAEPEPEVEVEEDPDDEPEDEPEDDE